MRLRPSSATAPLRVEVRPGVWLDSRLAVWLASVRLLVVADLHWGYALSHRARGNLLPLWGDDDIEQRLGTLIADYQPAEMIWLGDTVHAAEGAARADEFLRTAAVPILLVAGNHDRRWRATNVASLQRGEYFFHHGDATPAVPTGTIEIVGHHHPAAHCGDGAGSHVTLPALVASGHRLILPAFSPWAAGTPWIPDAGATVWAIAPRRIFSLPGRVSISSAGTA
jgi:uncharacterized protein